MEQTKRKKAKDSAMRSILYLDGRVLENGCILKCELASCPGSSLIPSPPYPPPAPAPPRPLLEPGQLYLMYSLLHPDETL